MLGKCCLFGVSDLFLTFPGVFFNFKKISTGSQMRNTVSNSQSKMITSTRNTNTSATSSTRTRRGGSCLKDIYETFLIYRTCMRRAPAKPVRACTLRKLCPASHVTLEAPRHTSHLTVFTLHTAPFAVNTSHFSVHTALSPIHTSHSTLHTSQSTLHTSHFTLHTSHSTLHTSHSTLHTALFISSELFSPYPSSSLPKLDLDAKATKRRFWSTF